MIFVTVGTHNQGFERLVKKMDEIAGEIDDKVVIQTGYTTYEPSNAESFKFLEYHEINQFYKNARVIVAHAGAGTLLDALNFRVPVIVVPRMKKYGEHIDDQQLELAEALEKRKRVVAVYDVGKIEETLENIKINLFEDKKKSERLKNFLKNNVERKSE